MKKIIYLAILFPFMLSAQQSDVTVSKAINRIAFGSCSQQNLTGNQLWSEINATNPDLWIWLGDNVYSDGIDMKQRRKDYDLQKSHPDYKLLLKQTEVIGIWDDHDFGVNDGGKEYPMKDESKEELFRFLDVPDDHPARARKGAYQSYTYASKQGAVKIILLDARYFRDSLKWNNPGTAEKEALVNENGDVLGEVQWKWFKEQLSEEGVDLFILGTGIQVIPTQHRWEKWSNFPTARKRLMEVISSANAPLVFISGDRHLSEVSRVEIEDYPYPVWEFTSSSLNSPSGLKEDLNKYRVGDKIHVPNFASMEIDWKTDKPVLQLRYYGRNNTELGQHSIQFE
ncbi:alkaline phosphatase D family protein [Ekhidna sp. MALMAid0563]|uniref:alkaline phosphatase D family protein n=1 Tax=Ekhidna sp. MALMAid0563 TaxID=3143937 RepID=UPI0032DFC3D6